MISGPDQQPAKAGADPLDLFHVLGEFSATTLAKTCCHGKLKMLIAPIRNFDLYQSLPAFGADHDRLGKAVNDLAVFTARVQI